MSRLSTDDKATNAYSARVRTLRQQRQEDLRERIDARNCFSAITRVENELDKNWQTLNRNQIMALAKRAEIAFRKLAKLLPDERIIDDTDGSGTDNQPREIKITWANGSNNPVRTKDVTTGNPSESEEMEPPGCA